MTEKKIDGIILDVDGTLWDSTPIVAEAWTRAVRENGHPKITITADLLKRLFGKTMRVIADQMLPQLECAERYALMDRCYVYEHEALHQNECRICYPGVTETIKELSKAVRLFIVSNCESGYIELFLEKTGLGPYISDIECYGNTGKNKGENIWLLAERNALQCPVYVGDTQGDCDAAREAGVPFLFAAYGFGQTDEADGRIESFGELRNILQSRQSF